MSVKCEKLFLTIRTFKSCSQQTYTSSMIEAQYFFLVQIEAHFYTLKVVNVNLSIS
jgi:hypothetical protein